MKFYTASVIIHLIIFVLYFEMNLNKETLVKKEDKSITISLDDFQSIPQIKSEKDTFVKKKILKKHNIQKKKIVKKKKEVAVKKKLIQNKIIEKPNIQQTKIIEKKEKLVIKKEKKKNNIIERSLTQTDTSFNKQSITPMVNKCIEEKEVSKGKIIANQKIKGLKYKILYDPPPKYPKTAKRMNIRKEIIVNVKFLVNSNGNVGKIEIQKKDEYGFSEEVERILKKWKFSSIEFNGEKTSFYFYKRFRFNVKG